MTKLPNPTIERTQRRLLTIPQVAEAWQVDETTVRRILASGAVRSIRIWRSVRVDEAEVQRVIREGLPRTGTTRAEGRGAQ